MSVNKEIFYRKSRLACCVKTCKSVAGKSLGVKYHRFPKNSDKVTIDDSFGNKSLVKRVKVWKQRCKIPQETDVTFKRVCSLHFLKEDYMACSIRLKGTAIPSQSLPEQYGHIPSQTSRSERLERRNKQAEVSYFFLFKPTKYF